MAGWMESLVSAIANNRGFAAIVVVLAALFGYREYHHHQQHQQAAEQMAAVKVALRQSDNKAADADERIADLEAAATRQTHTINALRDQKEVDTVTIRDLRDQKLQLATEANAATVRAAMAECKAVADRSPPSAWSAEVVAYWLEHVFPAAPKHRDDAAALRADVRKFLAKRAGTGAGSAGAPLLFNGLALLALPTNPAAVTGLMDFRTYALLHTAITVDLKQLETDRTARDLAASPLQAQVQTQGKLLAQANSYIAAMDRENLVLRSNLLSMTAAASNPALHTQQVTARLSGPPLALHPDAKRSLDDLAHEQRQQSHSIASLTEFMSAAEHASADARHAAVPAPPPLPSPPAAPMVSPSPLFLAAAAVQQSGAAPPSPLSPSPSPSPSPSASPAPAATPSVRITLVDAIHL